MWKWLKNLFSKKPMKNIVVEDDDPMMRFIVSEAWRTRGIVSAQVDDEGNVNVRYANGDEIQGKIVDEKFNRSFGDNGSTPPW